LRISTNRVRFDVNALRRRSFSAGRLRPASGLNTRLHAVTDAKGRQIRFFMTAGQVSDHTGAAALPGSLPAAAWMIADRGYDADWFRKALKGKGIRPRIPGRTSRGKAVRNDRCARTFLCAVALAATVMFWL
jgi:transposase